MNRPVSAESAKSQIRATVARALATALVTGIDQAAEELRPLSQVQQIDMATMAVMAYQHALEAAESLDFEADVLVRLAPPYDQEKGS